MVETRPAGDLAYRAQLNFSRLECHHYRVPEVFRSGYGWPGDWEGRTLLALSQLAQSLGREPLFVDGIVNALPRHLNDQGYFGAVWDGGPLDEQQIAGQSWYLRSLIELTKWRGGGPGATLLEQFVRNFLLRASDAYANYPTTLEQRVATRRWRLSNFNMETASSSGDVGCAFIMLDGATAALEHLGWPELRELCEVMIGRYAQLDFIGCGCQTHATLSGLRGVARYHDLTGSSDCLALVKRIYALYRSEAWTENFANFNWFGDPKCTETCAVVDSLMVAMWLWQRTGELRYLEDAHLIYYNGLIPHQRDRGCFGTDTCLGPHEHVLRPDIFDVSWCCTMRAAEGLALAAQSVAQSSDDALRILNYHDADLAIDAPGGALSLRLRGDYPQAGRLTLEVADTPGGPDPLAVEFFAPSWTEPASWSFQLNGQPLAAEPCDLGWGIEFTPAIGDIVRVTFDLNSRVLPTHNPNTPAGMHKYLYGALLLGGDPAEIPPPGPAELERTDEGRWRMGRSDYELGPLYRPGYLTEADTARRVLFDGTCEDGPRETR